MKRAFVYLFPSFFVSTIITMTAIAATASVSPSFPKSSKYDCLKTYHLVLGDKGSTGSTDDNTNDSPPPPSAQSSSLLRLTVAQGSVVDFSSPFGAIVNAANEGCLGGGGVDGAITSAGGPSLAADRLALPILYTTKYNNDDDGDDDDDDDDAIRCCTGCAKITGPGQYGNLSVPYVIHAVGPNYWYFDEVNNVEEPHRLLQSAYRESLDCTLVDNTNMQDNRSVPIRHIGFSLLSAGVFRGHQSLTTILAMGVLAIQEWAKACTHTKNDKIASHLEDIVLFAFTDKEANTLLNVCDALLLSNEDPGTDKPNETATASTMVEGPTTDTTATAAIATGTESAQVGTDKMSEDDKVEECLIDEHAKKELTPAQTVIPDSKLEAVQSPKTSAECAREPNDNILTEVKGVSSSGLNPDGSETLLSTKQGKDSVATHNGREPPAKNAATDALSATTFAAAAAAAASNDNIMTDEGDSTWGQL